LEENERLRALTDVKGQIEIVPFGCMVIPVEVALRKIGAGKDRDLEVGHVSALGRQSLRTACKYSNVVCQ
jgi:hypothetical protein